MPISPDLIHSADLLFRHMLADRLGGVWKSKDHHSSMYAPSIIVLAPTAFDAWLNEIISQCRHTIGDQAVAGLLDSGLDGETKHKYEQVAALLAGATLPFPEEMLRVVEIRIEVVYFLPYFHKVGDPVGFPSP